MQGFLVMTLQSVREITIIAQAITTILQVAIVIARILHFAQAIAKLPQIVKVIMMDQKLQQQLQGFYDLQK